MSAGSISAEVVDTFVHQGVGYYVIRTSTKLDSWYTTKRFSSFVVLAKSLEELVPASELPRAPSTGGKSGTSKAAQEARKVALNQFLEAVTADSRICRSFPLLNFLGTEDAPLPGKYRPMPDAPPSGAAEAKVEDE